MFLFLSLCHPLCHPLHVVFATHVLSCVICYYERYRLALLFASPELKQDKEFVVAAVRHLGCVTPSMHTATQVALAGDDRLPRTRACDYCHVTGLVLCWSFLLVPVFIIFVFLQVAEAGVALICATEGLQVRSWRLSW